MSPKEAQLYNELNELRRKYTELKRAVERDTTELELYLRRDNPNIKGALARIDILKRETL